MIDSPDPDLDDLDLDLASTIHDLRRRRQQAFEEFVRLSREIERLEAPALGDRALPAINILTAVLSVIEAHPEGISHKAVTDQVIALGATSDRINVRTRLRSLTRRGVILNVGTKHRPVYRINPSFKPKVFDVPEQDPYV